MKSLYEEVHKLSMYDTPSLTKNDTKYIRGLVIGTDSKTILDFGGGKGYQYSKYKLHRSFNIEEQNIDIYDIGVPKYSKIPNKTYDGVISTDVLEHIYEEDLDEELTLLFSKAKKFVFITIFCGPSNTVLSDGTDAHVTIKTHKWWDKKIKLYNTKNIPLLIAYRIPTKNSA
jgi:hypothetical protein